MNTYPTTDSMRTYFQGAKEKGATLDTKFMIQEADGEVDSELTIRDMIYAYHLTPEECGFTE